MPLLLLMFVTTVSFILNGKAKEKRISDNLTDKVLKYVTKVGYSPNHLAKSLRIGKEKLIFSFWNVANYRLLK
jgi:LacI family transcriptional regulator